MGQKIIKQPDGHYAIWSTVLDGFMLRDATRADVTEFRVEREAIRAKQQVEEELQEIDERGNPSHLKWEDLLEIEAENEYEDRTGGVECG